MPSIRYLLALFVITTLLPVGCAEPGAYGGISGQVKSELMSYAGVLARYWTLPEGDPGHPGELSEEYIEELTALCDRTPESWSFFYDCVSDTITALEPPEASCER